MHFKQRGFVWIEQILQDIRFGLRMLRRNPGFTAIAVITLALAIGVNSGVFSIVNGMLFKPLSPLRPNEVVNVYTRGTAADSYYRFFSFPEFSLLRESDEVFADVSAFQAVTVGVGANTIGEMRRHIGFVVSDNYFSMLGITPVAGRFFLPEESKPNANIPVVVVNQSLWESLGGGNDFSERTVEINGEVCTIVGVAPDGFCGVHAVFAPNIWLPMGMGSRINVIFGQAPLNSSSFCLFLIARLKPGLTLEAAKSRLSILTARLSTISVDDTEGARTLEIGYPSRFNISNKPSSDEPGGLFGALMIGMAGVVLLVACLNIANMFLARNTTRSDELAVRLALGASRCRIVRTLSVEGLIVSLMGGAAGMVLSHWANGFLLGSMARFMASSSAGMEASLSLVTTPDIRVLLVTLLLCVIATLVFAIAPAWHTIREIARGNLSLQHSIRTTTERLGHLFSGRHCLLMAQLAFSLALLFSAGLFFQAAHSAARLNPGFEPEGDLIAEIDYSLVDRDEASVRTSIAALADALRTHPDVRKVALASHLPFNGSYHDFDVSTAGATEKQARHADVDWTAVSRGYFDVLGIKLLRGRDFTDRECLQTEGPPVVIIDQGTASTLFPGEDPVGKYIRKNPGPGQAASEPMEIVGVVSAHWDRVISKNPPPRLFFPLSKKSPQQVFIHVRGQTAKAATSGTFRELVRSRLRTLAPDIPLVRLAPYPDILDEDIDLWVVRFVAVLFSLFGAVALLLAVIGVYGVRAFVIARRTREIGIRMALGASRRRIYALLMKQGAVQIAIGLCAGLMLSLAAGKLLTRMLLRVSPGDPLVLVLAALLLALTALLATWLPARRAAKVDPMEVLRWE